MLRRRREKNNATLKSLFNDGSSPLSSNQISLETVRWTHGQICPIEVGIGRRTNETNNKRGKKTRAERIESKISFDHLRAEYSMAITSRRRLFLIWKLGSRTFPFGNGHEEKLSFRGQKGQVTRPRHRFCSRCCRLVWMNEPAIPSRKCYVGPPDALRQMFGTRAQEYD